MPDHEYLAEDARFAASVPARPEAFPIKGCGALDWGMQSRMARIFRPATRRTVMLAIDPGGDDPRGRGGGARVDETRGRLRPVPETATGPVTAMTGGPDWQS